ncbi:hypothetical protein ATANTOWER_014799 [Ataeniobius toweri]|uniref:Secreted protein n=1 Tax=Ataeniobius toweri TaxID=208326 RepID=A0ABU7AF74_9TELE|nr:hypothetical protein [Ataeniobius toweri]
MTMKKLFRVLERVLLMPLLHWLVLGSAAPLHSTGFTLRDTLPVVSTDLLTAGAMAAEALPPAISVVRCAATNVTVTSLGAHSCSQYNDLVVHR